MKKIILLMALFVSVMFAEKTIGQVSLRDNISNQPIWGPVGYDHVEYYYLPEIETYYNVSSQRYVYIEGNQWVSRPYLPHRHKGYDVYHSRIVVVNEHKPYYRHHDYRARYSNAHGYSNHQSIRDSRDPKYYANRHHPQHNKYSEYKKNKKRNNQNKQSNYQNNPNHDNARDKNNH